MLRFESIKRGEVYLIIDTIKGVVICSIDPNSYKDFDDFLAIKKLLINILNKKIK